MSMLTLKSKDNQYSKCVRNVTEPKVRVITHTHHDQSGLCVSINAKNDVTFWSPKAIFNSLKVLFGLIWDKDDLET